MEVVALTTTSRDRLFRNCRVRLMLDKYARFFHMSAAQIAALMASVTSFAEDIRRQAGHDL